MRRTVKVEGLKEIREVLMNLRTAAAQRRVQREALRAGGEVFAEEARKRAPRDTGLLARRIFVTSNLSTRQRRAHRRGSFAPVEMHVGPFPAPRAVTQEFGTSFHPPQPYMRPAWDLKLGAAVGAIVQALQDQIMAEALKEERRAARRARRGRR
ncbi:HK97-gp10 family putative phage morphogenesis protein [Neomegalonema sp.]|uniref:HK97-gp10 family putative phage morphogenesis protein n=1 Tax=Neomegalonema sp. TaxID=2039713 RepID=UPI00262E5A41|nr:HK97-gp10 family putative phage morphogenesis protein [Neomegalonema sp.]MDD2870235.1 HK97 gp10 family phage protein [Neomegalonema sp.]